MEQPPADQPPAVFALGNFDGVHLGHVQVLQVARALADQHRVPWAVMTFEPHPRRFFAPHSQPFALQSSAQRARACMELGAADVIEWRFDAAFSQLTPAEFIERCLVAHGARGIVVGADFSFGAKRAGQVDTLRQAGARYGFDVRAVADVIGAGGERISSSAIRAALALPDLARAQAMLGRPFMIEGEVILGHQRGRMIDFPTANIALGAYTHPAFGVYAVRARLPDGAIVDGVANIGVKPTVEGVHAPLLEAHLFDFSADLYGQVLEVALIAFLRAEQRFASFPELAAQIARDAARARVLLGHK